MSSKLNSKSKWLKTLTSLTVHYLYVQERKKKQQWNDQLPRLIIKKPKIIGNIKEIKRPKIVGNIEEPNANRVIKIPKVTKVDDKRKRYVNPIMLNYVLSPTYLAALRKNRKKDEE